MSSKTVTFKVTRATVLLSSYGTDRVMLITEHPSPLPKVTSQTLTVSFDAEAETGVAYCREHFGIEPEVIST